MNPQKTKYFDISDISLLIVNLIPLFGSLFLGWNLFSILIIYWLESVVIGFYTILKMFISPASPAKLKYTLEYKTPLDSKNFSKTIGTVMKVIIIPFFIVHFSVFMLGHLVFIIALSNPQIFTTSEAGVNTMEISKMIFPLIITTFSLMLSHGISFYVNFIKKQEYKTRNTQGLMFSPYGRIIVMHLTLLFGGFLIVLTGISKSAIVLFIALKIIIDLRAHKKEHKKLENDKTN